VSARVLSSFLLLPLPPCSTLFPYTTLFRSRFALSIVRSLPARLLVAAMTLEGPGQGELAELVANHVLVDQHRDVVAAVMDGDRETHHLRQDHRTARPGLDRLLGVARGLDLLDQVMVDEGALLE